MVVAASSLTRGPDLGALFAEPSIISDRRSDGSFVLKSSVALDRPARCVGEWLEYWAEHRPNHRFLAERSSATVDWQSLTYGEALQRVRNIAGRLLRSDCLASRPIAILSENSVDHAVMMLAAMHVGIPVASISPAYSLVSRDHEKLKGMIELLDPGAIYASDLELFAPALKAIEGHHRGAILSKDFTFLAEEASDRDHINVEAAFQAVQPDTVAKLLFTSGSTGTPKAVINTQLMMTSNQVAKALVWPFLEEGDDLVILDWLPWSHTFGTNHNLNCVIRNGGALYIDGGKPMPGAFDLSLANLRDVIPTVYFNVPRGFEMLIAALRDDDALRRRFFSETKLIFYAGAALPQNLWEALEQMSMATVGHVVPLVSAWGSTETAPLATDCHFRAPRSGNIGVPVPGTEIKLVPSADKLEVRVRGPNVTPGYWKSPEQTAKAFDEEGFYMIGDAVAFADPQDPSKGLFFDGRVSEDFKLTTGTWVGVGKLRIDAISALAPVAQDIVVTGHDRNEVGFLIFPNVAACRGIADLPNDASPDDVVRSAAVRERLALGLAKLKARGGGSSTYASRAIVLIDPPSVDGGEITDKGYLNQRAVLTRRADIVTKLYDASCDERVDCPPG